MVSSVLGISAVASGEILVDLTPESALYDSTVRGIVNDGGNGPGTAGNLSLVPAIEDTGTYTHAAGFTFNIEFTPRTADLSGTRTLIEIGGNSSGSGLYLIDGIPTLLTKQGSNDAGRPTGFPDTSLNAVGVQSSIGKLSATVAYSFSASWNHAGTLELKVAPAGGDVTLDSFGISGTPANWSGNDTLSVAALARNNAGGLAGSNATNVFGPPFDVDDASGFGGTVTRAIFWNAHDVTPLELTAPVIRGFSVTKLPDAGQVRFHWNTTEGGLPNPTTLEIRDADQPGNPAIHLPAALTGFADVSTAATNFILTATNATGSVNTTRATEADTAYGAVVRASAPSAWYRFNEPTGSQLVADSAFNAAPHDGLLLGPAISGAVGFLDGAGAFEAGSAVIGNTILDPGTFVAVPDDGTPRNGFTIEAVIRRRPGLSGNHVIVSQTDVNGTGRALLGVNEDGTIYSNFPGGIRKDADVKLPPNVWAHLVFVVDPGTAATGTAEIRWYLDGVKIGTTTDGANPGGSTFDPNFVLESSQGLWIIGSAKSLSSEFWKGDIDDLAIYPSLLDDPDGNGDTADSRVTAHRDAWYAVTSGIIQFDPAAPAVKTGESTQLRIKVAPDVTGLSIDNGVGSVPLEDGEATVTVTPTATTTYLLTATGPGGTFTANTTVEYQQLTVPVVYGYEATILPATADPVAPARVRLHWLVTPGDYETPVSVVLKSGSTVLHSSGERRGYWDWETTAENAVDLTIEATNVIGTSIGEAEAPAADTPYSSTIRAAKPTAWFRFNEAAGSGLIVDSADNVAPHDGVLAGPAVSANAEAFIDRAGTFNASSSILSDNIINLGLIERGFSVEAIVRNQPGTSGTNRILISQQDLSGTGRQILSVDDNGYVRANFGGGVNKSSDLRVPGNTWTHVVLIADAETSELRWYIDGVYAGTSLDDVPAGQLPPNFEFTLGAWVIGANKTRDGNFWRGQIDEIVVYDKLLDDPDADGTRTDSLVSAHRNAWWNETSGLIYSGVSSETINAGESAELVIKAGADVTSVTVDNGGGTVVLENGNGTITLNPSTTTTYTITIETPNGPVTRTYTITVNGGASPLELTAHRIEGGNFVIDFRGAPSTTYAVKGTDNLASFPNDHGTVTTDSSGNGTATIAINPAKSSEFFRIEPLN